ncbi:MAG: choice-of-anchor D domain-containing protein [Cyclobacteriaceae bacterium]|nr:choice-of-anchor D domain-containing protein [Cyclobacteriaceae bacterium HetDA_MAG_MS6]
MEDRRGEPESRQLLREREVIYHKEKLSAVNLSLSGTIYWEDVESGENGWTTEAYSGEDLWHTQDRNYSSPFNSWWCGVEGLGDYKDVGRVNTAAVSPEINLTSVTGESLYLNFDESYWTESGYDFCMVDISTDGGATWVPLRGTAGEADAPSGSSQGWIRSSLDISAYIGESIHIRFYFDTGDQHQNWYSGWYFDNIQIATYPGSPGEWLRISTSNFQVNPDQSLDIEVTVDATTLNSGTYESAIIIYSNDPQATSIGVPVELDVMGAPKIQLATTAVNYESYYVGYAIEKTVEVRNVGSASLNIIDIASDVSEFYTNQNSSLLEPQQTMELSIFYQPDMVGLDEGTLTLYSDDPVSPQVTIALEGEGIEPPVIELSAAYLEQSLMAGESAIQNLTLGNTGANELEWELILTTSGTQSFDRDRSEDVMSTTFAPEEHGTLPSFAAVADVLEADLDAVPFYESFENGNYDGWEDGPDKAVREVTNETAAVGEYSFHYQNSEPASDHYRGVHKRFKSGSQPYHVSFYVKSASKLSNDGYFVLVDSEGYIVAFFYMRSNGKIYMNDVVTGDNTIPYNENQWYRIDLKDIDWNDKDFDFYVDHQLIKADIPFRRSEASDIAQAFMYNLDPSEAWWDDIRLGDSFSWISLDPTNGIVSSASSEQVEVGFDASELYGGSYEASLLVRNNDPGNQEIFVPISLNVAGIPDIQAPSTLTFEDAYIGYETTKVVEIQNTGTDMLAVSDIQFDEESYSVNISSFALAPEGTREVEITYHPTAMETDLATLTITSDDPDEETLLIELSGNGIHPPQLTLNPTSMSESLPIGGQSIRVLTIGNNQGLDEVRWELKTNYHPATESESMALFDAMEVHDILVNDKNSLKGAPSRAQAPERMQGQYLNGLPQYTTGSVADGDTLYLIDDWGLFTKYHIPSQTVAESIQLPYSVYGLALLDGTFWMSDLFTREVYGFDTNGNFVGFFSAPESGPKVIARDGEYLLITKASGWNAFDIGSFYRMDTEGNVLEIVDNPGLYLDGMTYTLGRLWGVLGNNNTFAYLYDFSVVDGEIQVNDFIYHNKTDDDFHFNLTSLDQKSIASIGFYGTLMEIHVPSWVGFEESSGVVAAGESQELNIAFDATNMVGGNYNAELTIVSNDPANPEWIVPMSLEVIGEPEIAIRTDVLDFGETYIGAAEIQSIWVINEGDGILSVSANLEANDHFDLEESNFQVPAFDSIEVSVVYAPQEVQDDQVILFISSNDTDEMESEVLLSGEGKEPPIIAVQPSEIIEALLTGESSIKTVTIDNTQGQDALSWALFSRENVEMDSPVTGNNYDYLWLDSDSVSSLYEWEEISDTGSSIIADIADESVSGPYPIGFDFPFYGNYYSVFYISSNGFITFNPNSDPGCCVGQPLPNEDNIDNLIAFAWENGYPRGDVFYDNQQDKTIIQFSDYGTYGSQFEGDITVQVIIYRDGQIKINYQSVSGYYLGNLLSVGIENEFGTEGVQVSLWESYIHNELSILFMPSPSWIEAEQYQGIIPAGESQALTIELDAADLAVGLYEASLLTLSNDPLDPIVEIPVELLVSNDVIIELTPDSYSVSQEIGETSFQVLTNLDQFEVSTTDEWLTVNQNGSIVSLEYQENESASNRIGEITISGGNTQAIFTLTQFGATPYLAVNPATVSVDFNAGTVAFDVTTNHEAYLISYEENGWCMVEDDGLGSITVNFLENESISERKMTITIEAGELLSELTLTQSGRALSIDESLGSYIYPNPSKGVFIIEGAKSEDVQIIDVTGKKVPFSQKMIDGKLYIDVGSRGNIYFVKYNHQVAKVIISK